MLRIALLVAAGLPVAIPAAALAEPVTQPTDTDAVRAMVAEMLADAESRSSLLQGGGSAGHDGKFFLASPDGNFSLKVSGQVQFRYIANFRDESDGLDPIDPADDVDDFDHGFAMSRTALRFEGNVIDPSIIYGVQANFETNGGELVLEDAFVGKVFDSGLIVLAGQYREPILWEDVIREKHSLAVDQSVMNAVFRQDRAQGVWLHKQEDAWRFWAGVNSGIRSENTSFTSQPADFGATTRWEYKLNGDWSQFDQFTSAPGSSLGSKLGGGVHYELAKHTAAGDTDNSVFAYTADYMVGGDGWSAYVAGVGLYTDLDIGGSFNDLGFLAQGSLYFNETWEGFVRYDVIMPDGDRAADSDFNTFTVGANHYIHGQAAKFTVDLQYFLDDTTGNALVSSITGTDVGDGIGLLASPDDGQFAIRAQFQLLF
jgi:hypothetical protein